MLITVPCGNCQETFTYDRAPVGGKVRQSCDTCRSEKRRIEGREHDHRRRPTPVRAFVCKSCNEPHTYSGMGATPKFCKPCVADGAYGKFRIPHKPMNKERARYWHLKSRFGITPEEFDAILNSQHGKCAICKSRDPKARNWHVDHDHVTGQVRGLLCGNCNKAIGLLQDDPHIIAAAAGYVRSHRQMVLAPFVITKSRSVA